MAELLKPQSAARVLRGRYKDAVVTVVREDDEQRGFWWCIRQDTSGGRLVLREVLISAGQLAPSEGGGPC